MGWRIEGVEKIFFKRDEFVGENDGIWHYAITIACVRRVYEWQMAHSKIEYDADKKVYKDDFNIPD